MKIGAVVLLVIGAVAATPRDSKIIGGQESTIDRYPAIVQQEVRIGSLWYFGCAGNIVNNYYILCAAHCTTYTVANIRWRAGTTALSNGGVVYESSTILNHPSYNRWTYDGDISLTRLSTVITYSDVVQTIPIPSSSYIVPNNVGLIIAGWGSTETASGSYNLREVTVNHIDWTECKRRYDTRGLYMRGNVTENMLCAGILDVGGKNACSGDSGGPAYYGNVLVGIVSWGEGCADSYFPGIKTKVSAYTDWIVASAV